MIRFPLLLAIAALGLASCRNDDDDIFRTPTPTPTPSPVTPTPTPGDGEDLEDEIDDEIDEEFEDDVTGDDVGAPMAASDEQVGIVSIDSPSTTQTVLTVNRANGEVWEFAIPAIPPTNLGTTLFYRNPALVFGSTTGLLIFNSGATSTINASARIR